MKLYSMETIFPSIGIISPSNPGPHSGRTLIYSTDRGENHKRGKRATGSLNSSCSKPRGPKCMHTMYLPVTHLEIVTFAYSHEFRDIYFLVVQASQRQSAYSSFLKIWAPGDATTGEWTDLRGMVRKSTWGAISKSLRMIVMLVLAGEDEDVDLSREDRVPRFWADTTWSDDFAMTYVSLSRDVPMRASWTAIVGDGL